MRLSKMTVGLIACLPLLTFKALATETLEAKVNISQYTQLERGHIIIMPNRPKNERFINPALIPKPKPKRGHIIVMPNRPK